MAELQTLRLDSCTGLKSLEMIKHLTKLKVLSLRYIPNLENLEIINYFQDLQTLDLSGCTNLIVFNIRNVEKLKVLTLNGCTNLESFDYPHMGKELQELHLEYCKKLNTTLDLSRCTKLKICKIPSDIPDDLIIAIDPFCPFAEQIDDEQKPFVKVSRQPAYYSSL